MKYTLPPKLAEIRRTLARSHNRRVLFLMVIIFVFILAAVIVARRHHAGVQALLLGTIPIEVTALIYIIRIAKKQSIALGFVCPLCGGALYDFGDNRLGRKGECPCCKQFIIDKLNGELVAKHP
jgi:hypothetical protein